jgi:hypothetical protein
MVFYEHVVLCIHITYHPQYDQTVELTTLVLIGTNNLRGGMVFSPTFNNISVISWRSVVLMEETGVPGENH